MKLVEGFKTMTVAHRDVQDLNSTARLLRYNNWQHDPLSAQGYEGPTEPRAPENAIAARYDLHPWPKVGSNLLMAC